MIVCGCRLGRRLVVVDKGECPGISNSKLFKKKKNYQSGVRDGAENIFGWSMRYNVKIYIICLFIAQPILLFTLRQWRRWWVQPSSFLSLHTKFSEFSMKEIKIYI